MGSLRLLALKCCQRAPDLVVLGELAPDIGVNAGEFLTGQRHLPPGARDTPFGAYQ